MTRDRTKQMIEKAFFRFCNKYGKRFKGKLPHPPAYEYSITGKIGGSVVFKNDIPRIKLNKWIIENNAGALEEILYHELAHVFTFYIHGHVFNRNGKRRIHGREWNYMMRWLGRDPKRTHRFRTPRDKASKLIRSFVYHCDCREYNLTIIRHRRVVIEGAKYYCKGCKSILAKGPSEK